MSVCLTRLSRVHVSVLKWMYVQWQNICSHAFHFEVCTFCKRGACLRVYNYQAVDDFAYIAQLTQTVHDWGNQNLIVLCSRRIAAIFRILGQQHFNRERHTHI